MAIHEISRDICVYSDHLHAERWAAMIEANTIFPYLHSPFETVMSRTLQLIAEIDIFPVLT